MMSLSNIDNPGHRNVLFVLQKGFLPLNKQIEPNLYFAKIRIYKCIFGQ